jgi:hypothetical protein
MHCSKKSYSITSSARSRIDVGTDTPISRSISVVSMALTYPSITRESSAASVGVRFQVEGEFKIGRLLDRKIGRLRSEEDHDSGRGLVPL